MVTIWYHHIQEWLITLSSVQQQPPMTNAIVIGGPIHNYPSQAIYSQPQASIMKNKLITLNPLFAPLKPKITPCKDLDTKLPIGKMLHHKFHPWCK